MIKMIKAEVQNLFHNHILLLSISVICLLPFLYSIFFLKSVWDPYGSTQDLPIAVVNRDVPVEYQGKKMAVQEEGRLRPPPPAILCRNHDSPKLL